MNELVQDLTSALEESELKIEVDEEQGNCGFLPRRRIRKHRAVDAQWNSGSKMSNTCNSLSLCHVKSSVRQCTCSEKNVTDSDTESDFVLPAVRRHRRRRTKHMQTEITHEALSRRNFISKHLARNVDIEMPSFNKVECKLKLEEESGISASEDSNEDINGQEGDDEMTDYHNEPGNDGSVWGVPHVHPWWEDAGLDDSKLKNIINGALPLMSDSAQKGYHARINSLPGMAARSIRRGRRRLKYKKISERLLNETGGKSRHKPYKRRKSDDSINSMMMCSQPIADDNNGRQMMMAMGWRPGEGLGTYGQGIQQPIVATGKRKSERLGVGFRR